MKNNILTKIVVLIFFTLLSIPAFALQITVGQLSDYVNQPGDKLDTFIAWKIQDLLHKHNLTLSSGKLFFHKKYPTKVLKEMEVNTCVTIKPKVELRDLDVSASASSDSVIDLNIASSSSTELAAISENLSAVFQASLSSHASGNIVGVHKEWSPGVCWVKNPFGGGCAIWKPGSKPGCYENDMWTLPFDATADADGHVKVALGLAASFDDQQNAIYLNPKVSMSGALDSISDWKVQPFSIPGTEKLPADPGDIATAIINYLAAVANQDLTDALKDTANDSLRSELKKQEDELTSSIKNQLGPDGLLYQLPDIDPQEHVLDLLAVYLAYEVLDNGQWLNPGYEYLKNNYRDLVYFALTGDKQSLKSQLTNAAACVAINQGRVTNMRYTSLYQLNGSVCSASDLRASTTGNFYTDPQCTQPADFKPMSLTDYCTESLNPAALGNADIWDGANGEISSTPWTLSPSTQINIGVTPIDDNYQPFTKRVSYKTIDNALTNPAVPAQDRICKLEMRIYKKDITAKNLKPMIAIHGGSWSYRGLGFLGMESQISQFTERGYVVFSPFYRLTKSLDGPGACNNVTGKEILDDMATAFAWVQNNMGNYGATGKVSLFGQSAGAFLADWMAVNYPQQVNKALLLYPPTDGQDYIDQVNMGNVPDALGVNSLKAFLGDTSTDPNSFDTPSNDPFVLENSFPLIVEKKPTDYPPMFIIHGVSDKLVPSRQSVLMCNGLAGNSNSLDGPAVDNGGDPANNQFSKTYNCRHKDSQLVLIAEANHMLDACPRDFVQKLAGGQVSDAVADKICPAGSIGSVREAEKQLLEGYRWLTITQPKTLQTCSVAWDTTSDIKIENNYDQNVSVYWLDYQCEEQLYANVAPGGTFSANSYVTHPWRIRESSTGKILKQVTLNTAGTNVISVRDDCSAGYADPTQLSVYNNTNSSVKIYWKDYSCRERYYFTVKPGQTQLISTYATHPWRIRKASNGVLLKDIQLTSPNLTQVMVNERLNTDKTDDTSYYQTHLVYVLPSDRVDEQLDLNGAIASSVAAAQKWLTQQSGGQSLRFDTYRGALDTSFVRLDKSDAQMLQQAVQQYGSEAFLREVIQDELHARGFNDDGTLYVAYYGGSSPLSCGAGSYPPNGAPGNVVALYLWGTPAGATPCHNNSLATNENSPGYWEFALVHTMFHALGAVPSCAPHYTLNGYVSDNPSDLMYGGSQPWTPSILDYGNDDYFNHGNPFCTDLAKSVFLSPSAATAEPPPGWQ